MEPFNYEMINLYNASHKPSTVHCKNTTITNYFARYLFFKLISVFKFGGLPEYWDKDYFTTRLYKFGFLTVFNTDKFGVIPQECSLAGYNVFYRPTYCIVANPLIRMTENLYIGKDCELIRLTPDYRGLFDLISIYADMMGLCLESCAVSLVNSKAAFIFKANDKPTAESFKKMYDTINSGEPAVFIDKYLSEDSNSESWSLFNNEISKNYITDKLLNDLRMIENMFLAEIGIPSANYNKKERMITDEVMANRVETYSNASVWLDCLKNSFAKVNDMFGLNLSVDWAFEGGENIGIVFDSGAL